MAHGQRENRGQAHPHGAILADLFTLSALQPCRGSAVLDLKFGSAVSRAPFLRGVGRPGPALAISLRGDVVLRDTRSNQVLADRRGPTLGQGEVVRIAADVIGVASNFHGQSRVQQLLGKQVEEQEAGPVDVGGSRGIEDVLNFKGSAFLLD